MRSDEQSRGKVPAKMTSPQNARGIPRGLAQGGLVFLSYGFRPFFLGAGLWSIISMIVWLALLTENLDFARRYGQANWHAHELLFGFAPAALVGYLMTTVPNRTGRFPLAGLPLAGLSMLWLAGRIAMLAVDYLPMVFLSIDWLFLPTVAFFCAREMWSAQRMSELRQIAALLLLAVFNAGFDVAVIMNFDTRIWARASLAVYVLLVTSTGAKLVPSFTNSWLAQNAKTRLDPSNVKLDHAILLSTAVALSGWAVFPYGPVTSVVLFVATICQLIRMKGWFNRFVLRAPMILVMHLAYACIPVGFLSLASASLGLMPDHAGLHLLGIGAVAGMIVAIMNRSIRLHTGRSPSSAALHLSSASVLLAGFARAAANMMQDHYFLMIVAAGVLWIAGFTLFVIDAAPLLTRVRRASSRQAPPPIRMNMR